MNGTSPHSKPGIARRMLARLRLLRMKSFRGKPAPVWFAEFDDGRLDLVEDGKTVFSIPLADIVAVGESTNADGPWSDDHFLVVRYREADEEKELELPFNERSGVGDSCTGLLRALGAPPVLPLLNCTHPASVFLWPPDKAGSPVWPDYGPTHSLGSDRDFARWRREHDRVLRRRMPASRTLLWLVCLGISLLTFVLVLAGTALSTGPTRILGAWFPIGLVWGLPALFVLSRFAVIEIARTPQHGYRRRVLLCGVPLSVRTVPEGRLVRVQEAGTGGWHGVSGITPPARLCVARDDGHHLLLGHFPCFLFGLDALPEAAFAPLGADDPDDRPAVDGAPPAWVEETLPPHTGTKRGERRREAVVRARAEVLAGLEPDDALALRAGNASVRAFAFAFLPFVAGFVALVIVGCLRPVPSWSFLLLLAAFASGIACFTTGSRKVLCPRCGSPAVSVRTFENGTRRYWLVCNACRIYAPGDNAGSSCAHTARTAAPCRRWLRRFVRLALTGVAFVVACNLAVLVTAAGRVTPVGRAAEAPARRAAVVMGCVPKLAGGWDNPYFTARIEAAAELWRAGKVEALIVSGDNHVEWYDEPTEMKAALVAAGVPEDRIVCDYAGFRTLDSVVRAKTIFGLDSFLVVSQDRHVRRATFLGRCKGLDAHGYAARGVPFGRLSSRTIVREPLARVAAVLDVLLGRRPRFGGPRVPLPQTAPSL